MVLLGLTPELLEWGAYCVSRNAPVVGIFDPDHRAALMASLRLACSAFPDRQEALVQATLALVGKPLDGLIAPAGLVMVCLGFMPAADGVGMDGPPPKPVVRGHEGTCARVQLWLNGLATAST